MAPLAALSIDPEGTAIGLRPPSQATYQALARHAGSLGRLYPKVNLMGAMAASTRAHLANSPREPNLPHVAEQTPVVPTIPHQICLSLSEFDLVRRRLHAAERHYRDTHRGD